MSNCSLKDTAYNGNCEECTKREYCLLTEIMTKLHSLEARLDQMKAHLVR